MNVLLSFFDVYDCQKIHLFANIQKFCKHMLIIKETVNRCQLTPLGSSWYTNFSVLLVLKGFLIL